MTEPCTGSVYAIFILATIAVQLVKNKISALASNEYKSRIIRFFSHYIYDFCHNQATLLRISCSVLLVTGEHLVYMRCTV